MAELSLREFHIPIPENITKDQLREVCARYEMLYNISLKTEAEIKQKMLARADKALLTNWECYSKYFLDAKLEYMERVFAKQGNRNDIGGHTEEAAVSAGCTAVAKAQLQAFKDILEGK